METKDENELNNIKEAVEIIAEKKKMPKELKNKIDKIALANFFMAIILMIILISIHVLKAKLPSEYLYIITKILPVTMALITIIVFEMAYKKDSGKLCITGIELLIFSICVLFIPYAYKYHSHKVISFTKVLPIFWAIYYDFKIMIIYIKNKNDYKNNISDVKKIIKNERKGYLDEESTKIIRERRNNSENKDTQKLNKPVRRRKSQKDIEYENAKIKVSRAVEKEEKMKSTKKDKELKENTTQKKRTKSVREERAARIKRIVEEEKKRKKKN